MAITIIGNDFNKDRFSQMAKHPLQSWQWGEARKKMDIEVLRLSDGKNVYQLTFHKIAFLNYKIGYLPRSVFPTKEVLSFLYDYGKKNKVVFIKIEPYVEKFQIPNSKFQTSSKIPIRKSCHPLFPNWTQILDLNKSEEELLRQMKSKTRYNIGLAQRKGVTIKEMSNEAGFKIFSRLYFETCKRQKYFGHTPKYHKIVWENLKNDIAHILIAFYKDIPLAAYELFYFNKVMYYPYGGTSVEFRNVMAANLLMWEAIRLGKKLGAQKFDMWGSLAPNYSQIHPWGGFTRFKEGYGTKFTEMAGSFDLVINKTIYQFYDFFYLLRSIYLAVLRSV